MVLIHPMLGGEQGGTQGMERLFPRDIKPLEPWLTLPVVYGVAIPVGPFSTKNHHM